MGFYYSLMDWHNPDWRQVKVDPAARKRFVEYTHGQLRELMMNYGKVDILWYDMAVPLDAAGGNRSEMNKMVLELQPDIVINNRNLLAGDFSTPEQNTQATKGNWESCMTINESWGYVPTDNGWKTPARIVQSLVECCRDGGNYLLNIGPRGDGPVPEGSVQTLNAVGKWLQKNGEAVYGTQLCKFAHGNIGVYTRRGDTLYTIIYYWPGEVMTVGGAKFKVKSAKFLRAGRKLRLHRKEAN